MVFEVQGTFLINDGVERVGEGRGTRGEKVGEEVRDGIPGGFGLRLLVVGNPLA
jgi:hypothetical protein